MKLSWSADSEFGRFIEGIQKKWKPTLISLIFAEGGIYGRVRELGVKLLGSGYGRKNCSPRTAVFWLNFTYLAVKVTVIKVSN